MSKYSKWHLGRNYYPDLFEWLECAAPIAACCSAGFFLTAEEQTSVSGIAADGYADFS